jgi:predicted ATPase
MLGDKRFLRTIRPRNILSFGPDTPELELQSLDVLIGPNGSGKSNLLEVISLLQAAPGNLLEPIQAGGGIAEWLWKGSATVPVGEIEVTVSYPERAMPLRHRLNLTSVGQRAEVVDEALENEGANRPGEKDVYFYYRYQKGHPVLNVKTDANGRTRRELRRQDLALDQSVLSQRKDPDQYPEITYLGTEYREIRLFREWNLGRKTPPRRPQPTDLPGNFLHEDAANIALPGRRSERGGLPFARIPHWDRAPPARFRPFHQMSSAPAGLPLTHSRSFLARAALGLHWERSSSSV